MLKTDTQTPYRPGRFGTTFSYSDSFSMCFETGLSHILYAALIRSWQILGRSASAKKVYNLHLWDLVAIEPFCKRNLKIGVLGSRARESAR